MATLKKYSNESKEIFSSSSILLAQDIKDYGKASIYKDDEGIYLNYKAVTIDKYMAIFLKDEEITNFRNTLKLHNLSLIEVFDCPEITPRKVFLTVDEIIFKDSLYSNEVIYALKY